MSINLSSLNPLGYTGTNVTNPTPLIILNRAPTVNDNRNVSVGTLWLNPDTEILYYLSSLAEGIATWVDLTSGGGGGAESFETDSGTAIESGGVVGVVGGSNINTSAATNIVTINLNGSPSVSGTITAGSGLIATTGGITSTGTTTLNSLNHTGVVQTNASGVLSSTNGTNGQLLIGGGTAPTWANLTSSDSSLTITNGANSINLQVSGSGEATIHLPDTSDNAHGIVFINDVPYLHAYGGTADNNVWVGGAQSGFSLTPGVATQNVGIGHFSGNNITTGSNQVLIGYNVTGAPTGSSNICIGTLAGSNYAAAETNNICIGSVGVGGESNAIHIRDQAGSTATSCFIGGISGVAVAAGVPVLVRADNQLGVAVSSLRFKENIKDMNSTSEAIYKLRPVTFFYKEDESKVKQFGLIAEEVNEVIPELVFADDKGRPFGVKYHELPPILLNEIQKQQKIIKEQAKIIVTLSERIQSIEEKLNDLQSV